MKFAAAILLALASFTAAAQGPADLVSTYSDEAARTQPGFVASAERGRAFFLKKWGATRDMPNCAACHTEQPAAPGRHVVTAKSIKPLAPSANPERFTSSAKVEKWFKRNCGDVLGRECTAAEKADFVQYIATAGSAS